MNTTIGILGNNFDVTTQFVEKLIMHTKASKDQEHIKMNIVINNCLLKKNRDEQDKLLENMQESNIDYLVLTMNDLNLNKLIEDKGIRLINKTFNINDNDLIKRIINLCGKEVIE